MTKNQVISVILKEDIELLQTLAFRSHVWIINTPKVREVCLSLWSLKDRNGYSLTHFNVSDVNDEKTNLAQAWDSIDVHHSSAFGAINWSEINIFSSGLKRSDIAQLINGNEEALAPSLDIFRVVRRNGI